MLVFGSLQDNVKGQTQGCFNGKLMGGCLKVFYYNSSLTENATHLIEQRDVPSVCEGNCVFL